LKIKIKLFLLFILISSCKKDFDLQGHRGYRGLYPENSVVGFKKSLELGVNTIELDVVISRDNKVIVSHEPWMSNNICVDSLGNKITDDKIKYNIYSFSYDDIIKFDCGIIGNDNFPYQINISTFKPTLNYTFEVLENYVKENFMPLPNYNIEIKSTEKSDLIFHPTPKDFSDLVLSVIDTFDLKDRVTIQSFDFRVLKYIKKFHPDIKLSVLVSENYNPQENIKDLGFIPDIYSPNYKYIKIDDLKFLRRKKIKIIPWTVNSSADIAKVLELNVDGIITDYPERVLKIIY
tara:strand:+ start:2820 stop:3692 length:873 start_codon:yes stop_codon:yes gene_type:complete